MLRPLFLSAVVLRPKDEVPMVGHEAIAQNADRMPRDSLSQNAFKGLVVAVLLEQRQPGHGPIEGMVDKAAGSNASATRRARTLHEP